MEFKVADVIRVLTGINKNTTVRSIVGLSDRLSVWVVGEAAVQGHNLYPIDGVLPDKEILGCIAPEVLTKIAKFLSASKKGTGTVDLSFDFDRLVISLGGKTFKTPAKPLLAPLPTAPVFEAQGYGIAQLGILEDAVKRLKGVCSKIEDCKKQPNRDGIYFDFADGNLTLVTTNGEVLSATRVPYEDHGGISPSLLPPAAVENLSKFLARLEGRALLLEIQAKDTGVLFTARDSAGVCFGQFFATYVWGGKYVSYKKLIQANSEGDRVKVPIEGLNTALDRVLVLQRCSTDSYDGSLALTWAGTDLEVLYQDTSLQTARDFVEVPSAPEGKHRGLISVQYLKQALEGACGASVELTLPADNKDLVVIRAEMDTYIAQYHPLDDRMSMVWGVRL